MSQVRFTLPSAVFLVLERDNQVLLMRRANTSWHNGDYNLPAGHIDGGEANTTATIREGLEELGVAITKEDLEFALLIHGLFSDGKEYYNVFFRVSRWEGDPEIRESDKCDALDWFDINELPDNLTPNTRMALIAMRAGTTYVEYGFDDKSSE